MESYLRSTIMSSSDDLRPAENTRSDIRISPLFHPSVFMKDNWDASRETCKRETLSSHALVNSGRIKRCNNFSPLHKSIVTNVIPLTITQQRDAPQDLSLADDVNLNTPAITSSCVIPRRRRVAHRNITIDTSDTWRKTPLGNPRKSWLR
ncbi:Uncharacterized protein HZ326_27977 [Fusarium oxysporum f. sp. albedinis]|nr:Uncharacterized protein HZ326_27977 [Fusarium oxysporum f. sp. albedinis]